MIKIYVSHSIRGKYGKDATAKEMNLNCQRAIKFGNGLRETFPEYNFYIPAEHDLFVQKAYFKNYLTEEQILDIDCDIITECEAMLIYAPDGHISRGMGVEMRFTSIWHIPTFLVNKDSVTIDFLGKFFRGL